MNIGLRTVLGLAKATHFGPTVLVVGIAFGVSRTQFSWSDSAWICVAILFGQFVVGWTNDLVDFPLDKAALRSSKPLVAGMVTEDFLKVCVWVALVGALLASLTSPLRVQGTAIHFLGLLSATAYNLKLKATVFSVVPYMISFGALPWAIYVAAGVRPPLWLVLAFVLIASAFHFLNVLKDLELDRAQDLMGLPQVLGRNKSIVVAVFLLAFGVIAMALGHLRF